MTGYEAIADRLDSISEDIGDLSIEMLREAIRSKQTQRSAADKKLIQARRAVDKAAHILRQLANPDSPADDFDE